MFDFVTEFVKRTLAVKTNEISSAERRAASVCKVVFLMLKSGLGSCEENYHQLCDRPQSREMINDLCETSMHVLRLIKDISNNMKTLGIGLDQDPPQDRFTGLDEFKDWRALHSAAESLEEKLDDLLRRRKRELFKTFK